MSYHKKKRKSSKKGSNLLVILISLVVLAGISLLIASVWQKSSTRDISSAIDPISGNESTSSESSEAPVFLSSESSVSSENSETLVLLSSESSVAVESNSSDESTSISDDEASSKEDETSKAYTRREEFYYALAQNDAPVSKEYFSDALFLGDSITTGIPLYLYSVLSEAEVIAEVGIGPHNAISYEMFPIDGLNYSLIGAAQKRAEQRGGIGKIYLLLGGNTLGNDQEYFISSYRKVIQEIKKDFPGTTIYVQSMTPVTINVTNTYPALGTGDVNIKINKYNLALMELAKEEGVYYLDIASVMVDEEGRLPTDASPSDGMHFGSDYYLAWYEYLRNHTAEE